MTKKRNVISIRFRDDELEPYRETIKVLKKRDSSITDSSFFRNLILKNYDKEFLEREREVTYRELLFYYNKSSNNINQLAKKVNTESLKGGLSEQFIIRVLNSLELLNESLRLGIEEFKGIKNEK